MHSEAYESEDQVSFHPSRVLSEGRHFFVSKKTQSDRNKYKSRFASLALIVCFISQPGCHVSSLVINVYCTPIKPSTAHPSLGCSTSVYHCIVYNTLSNSLLTLYTFIIVWKTRAHTLLESQRVAKQSRSTDIFFLQFLLNFKNILNKTTDPVMSSALGNSCCYLHISSYICIAIKDLIISFMLFFSHSRSNRLGTDSVTHQLNAICTATGLAEGVTYICCGVLSRSTPFEKLVRDSVWSGRKYANYSFVHILIDDCRQ